MSKAPDLQMICHTSLVSIKYFCVQLYSVTNVSLTQFLKFTRILMQPCNIFQQIFFAIVRYRTSPGDGKIFEETRSEANKCSNKHTNYIVLASQEWIIMITCRYIHNVLHTKLYNLSPNGWLFISIKLKAQQQFCTTLILHKRIITHFHVKKL
jgi:hypothetical protein